MPRQYTPRVPFTCEQCGTTSLLPPSLLRSRGRARRYCSPPCAVAAARLARERARSPLVCPCCGRTFFSRDKTARYCSPSCAQTRVPSADHFDRLVDRSGGPDACWPWLGGTRTRDGYGRFQHAGQQFFAHRYAFARAHGAIPADRLVCHRCDNPPCCNPAHLFLGTPLDNMRDKIAKGRDSHGERNGRSVLTAADVAAIRAAHDAGATNKALAARFHVATSTISDIVLRQHWRHLP